MLYKIVPFLTCHHLPAHAPQAQRPPGVKHFIPDARARAQFWLQAAATLLLLGACWYPAALAAPAGLALAAAALWLAWNLAGALRVRLPAAGNRDTTGH